MRVNITANTCTIDNNVYLNSGEYNINKFYFTFSEEYLDEYVKKALFIDKDGTPIKMVIANNECDIPYDILKNPGTYTFGVYAYEMNGTELVLRYSPEPTHFYVNKGSYIEGGASPTDPTPDEFAQYYQAMQDLIANTKPELIDYIEDNLPTIHVGETSTLTPGTPATVTNVGTERNPIFDFGIPQGAPGTTDYNELVNKPDLTVFALITESANKIALEMDSTEFKIKAKIFDKNNRLISESNVIDLPLESVVVSGEYDATNKKIILTLENGNVIEIPVEDLIDGLATKTELEEGLATKDANIIESISKNGAPLPVNANKNVNITVPTKTSEVINDIGFITNDTNGLSHYYNKTAADTRFSLVTETGSNFTLSIDPTTFVMTAILKDKNGRALSTQTVDLPLESVVVGGRYDSETREVVLTLENGSVVRFSVADLVSGLQSEITDSNKLSSDLVDDTNSVNKFVTTEEKTQIATNENDISDIKDEQEIQNEHLDELDMIYNAFSTVSAENETIQLDNTAKVKFKEIDLKGNTSQVVIPEEQGTNVSNTSIYVSDVNTDKESSIEIGGNTYQKTTTGKNLFGFGITAINKTTTYRPNATQRLTLTAGDNVNEVKFNYTSGSYCIGYFEIANIDGTLDYTISFDIKENTTQFAPAVAIDRTNSTTDKLVVLVNGGNGSTKVTTNDYFILNNIQVELGSTATNFEPYTNGASPNPDYPQNIDVITGTQNVKVCGKNLNNGIDYKFYIGSTGTTYRVSGNDKGLCIEVNGESSYTISTTTTQNRYRVACCNSLPTTTEQRCYNGTNKDGTSNNITINTSGYKYLLVNATDLTAIQIEQGSTATTYEQYKETTYPVNLGNIELCKIGDYQDYFYKDNGKWYIHKDIGKVVLDGSEDWELRSDITSVVGYKVYRNKSFDYTLLRNTDYGLSNYFKYVASGNIPNTIRFLQMRQYAIHCVISEELANDASIFKTWLSTHNTTVYYILATPTTTEITDTTLVNQLNTLYNATIYHITNINTDTSNLLPYIDLHYNFVTPSPSPSRPSQVNVVKGDNTITISNSDNTESQNYPINLGDIELCKIGTYQDYIYESNGNWFKKGNISKVVLNGSENWVASGTGFYCTSISDYSISGNTPYCNYFKGIANVGNISSLTNSQIAFNNYTGFNRLYLVDSKFATKQDLTDWLGEHNTTLYYALNTSTDTQITDTTLITQLNNIKKAYSYDTQTNISQTNTDKPFIIYAEAIDNNADLLTDYVKNTDYATNTTGGVVKVFSSRALGMTSAGALQVSSVSYNDYNNLNANAFIGKGTLENVITGKGLVSNTDYATANKGGVIKTGHQFTLDENNKAQCNTYNYSNYNNAENNTFVSKGTLENVITGKDLTTKAYVDGLVGDISSVIDAINGEVV